MEVVKRDGQVVTYDGTKIVRAVEGAMLEVKGVPNTDCAKAIEKRVRGLLDKNLIDADVESIQDAVETELMKYTDYLDVAKAYILYRDKQNSERNKPNKYKYLTKDFIKPYKSKGNPFPEELGTMVYKRTYARLIPEEGRREDWWETIARVVDFSTTLEVQALQRKGIPITEAKNQELMQTAERIYDHMFNLGLFPSGRSLWVGGTESSYKYPLSNFNCSFVTIDSFEKFSEMFFVLMLGTGVGLSVERKYVQKMPRIRTDIQIIHKDYVPVDPKDRLEFTELTQTVDNILTLNIGDSKFGR